LHYFSSKGVDRIEKGRLSDARLAMTNFVADVLSAYRKEVGTNQPAGQLLAPEALKLLPLYVNALMRHVSFSHRAIDECFLVQRSCNTISRCLSPTHGSVFSPCLLRHARFPLTSAHVP
jgi:hypothetical protein